MRSLPVIIAALSLLACTSGAAAGVRGGPPPFPTLPGTWSHAEINITIRKHQHTLILDRGRVLQGSFQQILVHRADGTNVTIPLSARTIVTPRRYTFAPLHRGLYVTTIIVDAGA